MKNIFKILFVAVLTAAGCGGNGNGDQDAQEDGVDQVDRADQGDDAAPPDSPPDQPVDAEVPPDTPPPDVPLDDNHEEPPPCTGETWAFTTVSDSYSGLEGNLQVALQSAFLYNEDLKFIVSTGDFENLDEIDGRIQADLLSYFPGRDVVPWFIAIGNHNVEDPADMDFVTGTLGPRLATQLEGMTNFREGPFEDANYWTGHYTTYSFDYRSAHFVIMNQYLGSTDSTDGHPLACPWDALLEWLEADLSSTVMPLIFVFGHEPPWPREESSNHCGDSLDDGRCPGNTADPPDDWKFIRPQRDRFWQILRDYHAVAHFDGHTHQSAARPVHGITDFDMASCIDTEWNCYCMIEGEYPEAADGGSYTPSDGTVDFNDGLTMADGPVNIIRVDCSTVAFGIYDRNDSDGTLSPRRAFTYTVGP